MKVPLLLLLLVLLLMVLALLLLLLLVGPTGALSGPVRASPRGTSSVLGRGAFCGLGFLWGQGPFSGAPTDHLKKSLPFGAIVEHRG